MRFTAGLPLASLARRRTTSSTRLRSAAESSQHFFCFSTSAAVPSPTPKKPTHLDDATSALDYKLSHPHHGQNLPTLDHSTRAPRSWSAQEAVSNILYNTPPPNDEPFVKHTLNALVQNEPGVLARVSSTLAARGFNIESLAVCQTEVKDLSRMNIVLRGQPAVMEQARRQLEDLVPVWAVLNYTNTDAVARELLLCKVSIVGPDFFESQLARRYDWESRPADQHETDHLDEGSPVAHQVAKQAEAAAQRANPYTSPHLSEAAHAAAARSHKVMSASEALAEKHGHLKSIELLARQFEGRLADISNDCCIVELTGTTKKIDSFLKLVRPYGILEMGRSGLMVIPRGWASDHIQSEENVVEEEPEIVDSSTLPPG